MYKKLFVLLQFSTFSYKVGISCSRSINVLNINLYVSSFCFLRFFKGDINYQQYAFCWFPTFFIMLLIINYHFSFNIKYCRTFIWRKSFAASILLSVLFIFKALSLLLCYMLLYSYIYILFKIHKSPNSSPRKFYIINI